MKTFFLLAILILTQALGDIGLSRGMKDFGVVNPLDFGGIIPLITYLLTNVWIWIGVLFLIISLIFYLTAISRFDLSFVLPIHSFSYVVNAFLAWILLGEQVLVMRWLSTLIISSGVLLVSLSKRPVSQPPKLPTSPVKIGSRNIPFFLLPFSLSVSKTWLAVIVISLADSAGDLLLACGMKQVGSVGKMGWRAGFDLVRNIITNPAIISGIACQAIAFFTFIAVLSWADISFVRPATALTYLFSMLGAKLILKETFSRERLMGTALIGFGIFIHQ
ncbi:MAG: hypothetical protein VKJ02_09985 [Snowella sp.]|nr:hypothetical protein [Snowella sp.]